MNPIRKSVATVAAAGVLLGGGMAAPAYANQHNQQDGLVNVIVEDSLNNLVTIEDVNIGVTAQIAANVCGVKVGPLAVLGRAVDRSGATDVVCDTDQGRATFTQN